MPKNVTSYTFFLGHQPHLSVAELEAVFGTGSILEFNQIYAILELQEELPENQIDSLGGTKSIAKLIKKEQRNGILQKQLLNLILENLSEQKKFKLKLGVSIYSDKTFEQPNAQFIQELLEEVRHHAKKQLPDLNLRTVEPKSGSLSSAQIIHSGLLKNSGLSLSFIIQENQIVLAQTIQAPNLKKYTLRDYGKPKPSGKNGMLPPKLAQILLNLSAVKTGQTVLDPFCGSGTLLQEALLRGINCIGSDLNPQMVNDARLNLEWLKYRFRLKDSSFEIFPADATCDHWDQHFDVIVTESYLGRPLSKEPSKQKLNLIIQECNEIAENFLLNIHPQIKNKQTLIIALPCWFVEAGVIKLPVVEKLSALGYNLKESKKVKADLIYHRSNGQKDQIVGRDIYALSLKI
jgi:tRNA G10  N-methylase Trm11